MASRGRTYRIDPGAPVGDELRRIAAEVVDAAASNLRTDAGVVTAGLALADARSLVRLGRGGLEPAARRSVVRRIRVAQRTLPPESQGPALTASFDLVASWASASITADALDRLRVSLRQEETAHATAQALATLHAPAGSVGPRSAPAEDLDAAVLAVSLWRVEGKGFEVLAPGLAREYRRARITLRRQADDLSADSTRAVLQRVQDHHRHLRLLRSAWPPVMKVMARECHTLLELAEHQHSMGRLRDALLSRHSGQLRRDARALVGVIDADRGDLAAAVAALGARVFAEEPDALVRRLSSWWTVATAHPGSVEWPPRPVQPLPLANPAARFLAQPRPEPQPSPVPATPSSRPPLGRPIPPPIPPPPDRGAGRP